MSVIAPNPAGTPQQRRAICLATLVALLLTGLILTAGPVLTSLLAASALVTWVGLYASTGMGD